MRPLGENTLNSAPTVSDSHVRSQHQSQSSSISISSITISPLSGGGRWPFALDPRDLDHLAGLGVALPHVHLPVGIGREHLRVRRVAGIEPGTIRDLEQTRAQSIVERTARARGRLVELESAERDDALVGLDDPRFADSPHHLRRGDTDTDHPPASAGTPAVRSRG